MGKQLDKIQELIERREKARLGGGEKAIAKQHEKGKFTARERINMLLDEGSFEELDMFVQHRCTNFGMEKKTYDGDGVVTGFGTVGPPGLRLCTGCHRHRRLAGRDHGIEDV